MAGYDRSFETGAFQKYRALGVKGVVEMDQPVPVVPLDSISFEIGLALRVDLDLQRWGEVEKRNNASGAKYGREIDSTMCSFAIGIWAIFSSFREVGSSLRSLGEN